MTTQSKREFKSIILTETEQLKKFIEGVEPSVFVKLHQDNFKDNHLSKPYYIFDKEYIEDLGLYDTITYKYRDWFNEIGLDKTIEWLNEDELTRDAVAYFIGLIDEPTDFDPDETFEYFDNLRYNYSSGWGESAFVCDLLQMYIKENHKELYEELFETFELPHLWFYILLNLLNK